MNRTLGGEGKGGRFAPTFPLPLSVQAHCHFDAAPAAGEISLKKFRVLVMSLVAPQSISWMEKNTNFAKNMQRL